MNWKEGERNTFFISGHKGLVQAVHVIKTASPKSLFNGQLDNRLRLLVCGIIMLKALAEASFKVIIMLSHKPCWYGNSFEESSIPCPSCNKLKQLRKVPEREMG